MGGVLYSLGLRPATLAAGNFGSREANLHWAPRVSRAMDWFGPMPAKKNRKNDDELRGPELVKEACRRLRLARSYWKAHRNKPCRRERDRALALYERLSRDERAQVPQELRVWLRYRSEKYFGAHRTPPGSARRKPRGK